MLLVRYKRSFFQYYSSPVIIATPNSLFSMTLMVVLNHMYKHGSLEKEILSGFAS